MAFSTKPMPDSLRVRPFPNESDEYFAYKYERPSLTVDIVALWNSNLLLITRKNDPFKGCAALPGGFVDVLDYDAQHAAAREFEEECSISADPSRFKPLPARTQFNRDPRGWVASVPHRINLTEVEFYTAQAADDADTLIRADLLWGRDIPTLAFDHLEILHNCLTVRFGTQMDF